MSPRAIRATRAPESDEQRHAWDGMFQATYERTAKLLERIPPDSPLGRAVSLVGEAIWTVDPEERFFYAWRAVEVVANFDLSEARRRLQNGDEAYAVDIYDWASHVCWGPMNCASTPPEGSNINGGTKAGTWRPRQ